MRAMVRYAREGAGLEFDRVSFFTDAVFAIALTLLVVEVGVPEMVDGASDDPAVLVEALQEKLPLLAAFFLGCLVIGFYWSAHHRFMANLRAVDQGIVLLTIIYLTFVALLPFPIGVLGEFPRNPISFVAFAVNMGAVSTIEAVLFAHAWRQRLLRQELPRDVYRWMLQMSLLPVLFFAVSLPVAFVVPWLAVVVWGLSLPLQAYWTRRSPAGAAEYLS
jgi:uncharacterized membrane protein